MPDQDSLTMSSNESDFSLRKSPVSENSVLKSALEVDLAHNEEFLGVLRTYWQVLEKLTAPHSDLQKVVAREEKHKAKKFGELEEKVNELVALYNDITAIHSAYMKLKRSSKVWTKDKIQTKVPSDELSRKEVTEIELVVSCYEKDLYQKYQRLRPYSNMTALESLQNDIYGKKQALESIEFLLNRKINKLESMTPEQREASQQQELELLSRTLLAKTLLGPAMDQAFHKKYHNKDNDLLTYNAPNFRSVGKQFLTAKKAKEDHKTSNVLRKNEASQGSGSTTDNPNTSCNPSMILMVNDTASSSSSNFSSQLVIPSVNNTHLNSSSNNAIETQALLPMLNNNNTLEVFERLQNTQGISELFGLRFHSMNNEIRTRTPVDDLQVAVELDENDRPEDPTDILWL